MEKEFVPYEQSLELKELGFDEPCFGYYDSEGLQPSDGFWWNRENKNSLFVEPEKTNNPKISAPTFSQAFRWFRENYGLCQIVIQNTDKDWTYDVMSITGITYYEILDVLDEYEEAELECLKKLIQIVKEK